MEQNFYHQSPEAFSAEEPERVEKLSEKLGNYLREVGGQRPIFKETGKPTPWPDEIKDSNNPYSTN